MNENNRTQLINEGTRVWRKALVDEFSGTRRQPLNSYEPSGESDEDELAVYFGECDSFGALEKRALDECRGRVLDVAATAGRHSLELQVRGFDVVALDIAPECADVMAERGVRQIVCADAFTWRADHLFDSILLLYDAIGIAGTLQGLRDLLDALARNLSPGGQILLQSEGVPEHVRWSAAGDFWGEESFRFEYEGQAGPFFPWLSVDPVTLSELYPDWEINVLATDDEEYLACLHPGAAETAPGE